MCNVSSARAFAHRMHTTTVARQIGNAAHRSKKKFSKFHFFFSLKTPISINWWQPALGMARSGAGAEELRSRALNRRCRVEVVRKHIEFTVRRRWHAAAVIASAANAPNARMHGETIKFYYAVALHSGSHCTARAHHTNE